MNKDRHSLVEKSYVKLRSTAIIFLKLGILIFVTLQTDEYEKKPMSHFAHGSIKSDIMTSGLYRYTGYLGEKMINEKFLEVIAHEGVVALVTDGAGGAHVSNTWNSYLVVNDGKILAPAAGMRKTQKNIDQSGRIKITLGSREVMGYNSMGTGFLVEGKGRFLESGEVFDMMKDKFSFLSRVLEITPETITQTL